jgi:hypothetical protein
LSIHGYRFTFKHLCWHSITKILRNGPRAHFPFTKVHVSAIRIRLRQKRKRSSFVVYEKEGKVFFAFGSKNTSFVHIKAVHTWTKR